MVIVVEKQCKWPVGQKSDEEYLAEIRAMATRWEPPLTAMPEEDTGFVSKGTYKRRRAYLFVCRWRDTYYVARVPGRSVFRFEVRKLGLCNTLAVLRHFDEDRQYRREKLAEEAERKNRKWYALGVPHYDEPISNAFRLANGGWLVFDGVTVYAKLLYDGSAIPFKNVPIAVACGLKSCEEWLNPKGPKDG